MTCFVLYKQHAIKYNVNTVQKYYTVHYLFTFMQTKMDSFQFVI
jgi:hypothetical protein